MEPTKEMVKQAGGAGPGQRFLHVGVSQEFLRLVNVESAQAGLTVKDFVITCILRGCHDGPPQKRRST